MSGIKGRSGPVGNLNATRRPWRVFWRRRALRQQDRWILPLLESYMHGLLSDKPDMTEGEKRLAELAQMARACTVLILSEAAQRGFIRQVDGTFDVAPGVKDLPRFLNVERQSLEGLGLQRRAKTIGPPSLKEIKARYSTEEGSPA